MREQTLWRIGLEGCWTPPPPMGNDLGEVSWNFLVGEHPPCNGVYNSLLAIKSAVSKLKYWRKSLWICICVYNIHVLFLHCVFAYLQICNAWRNFFYFLVVWETVKPVHARTHPWRVKILVPLGYLTLNGNDDDDDYMYTLIVILWPQKLNLSTEFKLIL